MDESKSQIGRVEQQGGLTTDSQTYIKDGSWGQKTPPFLIELARGHSAKVFSLPLKVIGHLAKPLAR